MAQDYDVIVIGVGMAGVNIARKTRSAGKQVAVVDSRPYGGTCALRGCDPKKVLVGAAELLDWARRMSGLGVSGELHIDWPDLMQFKRTFTEPTPGRIERAFSRTGVAAYHGEARFLNENSLQVGDQLISARHIVVATGSGPRPLMLPGADYVVTSTDFLELETLPDRILFIGGGYISFEFAHIAARAGAKVTILHRDKQPLNAFDPDLVEELLTASRALGIDVLLQSEVTAVEASDAGFSIRTHAGQCFSADLVVHGAGRIPEIDALDLHRAGVEYGQRGIVVNDYLQSVSNPGIYAAGDSAATGGPPLTPVAVSEGFVVASNILEGNTRTLDYSGTPSVVFTIPALARTGLLEEEARQQGLDFSVKFQKPTEWYNFRRTNEQHAAFKVLIENHTGRILGAHLLGAQAGEMINLFSLAIRHGLTASDIKKTIFVHPASSSDISYMV